MEEQTSFLKHKCKNGPQLCGCFTFQALAVAFRICSKRLKGKHIPRICTRTVVAKTDRPVYRLKVELGLSGRLVYTTDLA